MTDGELFGWFKRHRLMFFDVCEAAGYEDAYDWLVRCALADEDGIEVLVIDGEKDV